MGDIASVSAGPQIVLATEEISPPNSVYIDQSNNLLLLVGSSVACTLFVMARIVLPDGTISLNNWPFVVPAQRAQQTFSVSLSEGFLLSLHVYCPATALRRGQVYVSVALQRDVIANKLWAQRLTQGWVTNYAGPFWPGAQNEDCYSGYGNIRSITGTLPAAGAEISETVPANCIWRLRAFLFSLTTAAAVANRFPHFIIDDGTNSLYNSPANAAQVAAATVVYSANDSISTTTILDGVASLKLGSAPPLLPGFRLRTLTTAIQAADQYTAPQYLVEEWFTG
jgi:hypothetical protein